MFTGREKELQYLNDYYEKSGTQILVVYGQKGIGKTADIIRPVDIEGAELSQDLGSQQEPRKAGYNGDRDEQFLENFNSGSQEQTNQQQHAGPGKVF